MRKIRLFIKSCMLMLFVYLLFRQLYQNYLETWFFIYFLALVIVILFWKGSDE